MASATYKFTPNGEIDEYITNDTELALKGYVEKIEGRKTVSSGKKDVFKVIVNNATGRRVRVLFWNQRAHEFIPKIHANMILNIRGAYGRRAHPIYSHSENGTVADIELSVGTNTTVEMIGIYDVNEQQNDIVDIEFKNLNKLRTTLFRTNAFIKKTIVFNEFNGATCGSGVLTDGTYRVRVQVTNFDKTKAKYLTEGCHVIIDGEIRPDKDAIIAIYVKNMDKIVKTEEPPLTEEELNNGYRSLKRITPFEADVEICPSPGKKSKIE